MTAKEKIVKARTALIMQNPFFGSLAIRLQLEEGNKVTETLATDGIKLFYNYDYVMSLTMDDLKFILCHEVMHLVHGHHTRMADRDIKDWNRATDYSINGNLMSCGFNHVDGMLFDKQFENMTADEVYNKLHGGKKQGNQQQQQQQNQQGQQQQQQQQGGSGNQQGKGKPKPGQAGEVLPFPGSNPDGTATEAEAAQQQQDWQIAATQANNFANKAGQGHSEIDRLIKELNAPKIDWREVLQRFVEQATKNDYTFKRVNSRYAHCGVILPSLYNQELPPIVVAVDTSGSVTNEDLKQFASEIESIMQLHNVDITVIYCDDEIAGIEEFTAADMPLTLNAKGGGGTAFAPVFEHIEKEQLETPCIIYLTDLECRESRIGKEPDKPVLWIQTGREKAIKMPFGEVIKMH